MDGTKEYICIESPNEVEGGMLVREQELIRCKDCKNNPSTLIGWIECPMTGAGTRQPNDFCSYAEPKEQKQ